MNDLIAQLAAANPIHVEDIGPLAPPDLVEGRSGRLALAVAVVAAAVAASLVGIFAFGGNGKSTGRVMPAIPPGFAPLADASKILGFPVVLPDTALVTPADAAKTVETVCVPKDDTVDPGAGGCQVRVSFPGAGLTVTYVTFPGAQSLQTSYEQIKQQNSGVELLSLGGVQALFVPQQDSWIQFELGGTQVTVEGAYDKGTLEAVAQSIVDRTPAADIPAGIDLLPIPQPWRRISLRTAAASFGAPLVLPRAAIAGPAREVQADGTCRPGCLISIGFPRKRLSLLYQRPAFISVAELAKKVGGAGRLIKLNGVRALAVNVRGRLPSRWVAFVIDGTRVVVSGYRGEAALEAVARSIVDRSK